MSKKIQGLLINPYTNSVTKIEVNKDNGIQEYYDLIGCRTFEAVDFADETLYCDEEFLLNYDEDTRGFIWKGAYGPILGKAVIVGLDEETGDDTDTKISLMDDIILSIKFIDNKEFVANYLQDDVVRFTFIRN